MSKGGPSLELALFMPNVGTSALSTLETSTTWRWNYHRDVARYADANGYDALISINQWAPEVGSRTTFKREILEPIPYAAGLLAITERIRVFSTVYSAGINPYILAKMGATCDHMS